MKLCNALLKQLLRSDGIYLTIATMGAVTTEVVSSNPVHVDVYSILYYMMKFVSDLQQVGGFLRVLRFSPAIKMSTTITEILLKEALNTINQNQAYNHYLYTGIVKLNAGGSHC